MKKIVVIGGGAAGAKAASKAKRLNPNNQVELYTKTSEIVQLSFDETITDSSERKSVIPESSFDTTIRIQKHGFLIELSNHAARDTILAILSVLQNLC